MKTLIPKKEDVQRKWYLIDAQNKTLGRLAVRITNILRGKDKTNFIDHVDTGDFVVVINAEKIKLTGKKEDQKIYQYYTGFSSGQRNIPIKEIRERKPEMILEHAVQGMMPKNKLARQIIKKLKVYKGSAHPHKAQNPVVLDV